MTSNGYDSSSTTTITDKTTYVNDASGHMVFLPSYGDMKSYGYTTNATDANRIKYPTDYAGATGARRYKTVGYGGYYWLRSPNSGTSDTVWIVNEDGYMPGSNRVTASRTTRAASSPPVRT